MLVILMETRYMCWLGLMHNPITMFVHIGSGLGGFGNKNNYHSQLDNLKLNLSQSTMNIGTASFDEFTFPRKYIGTCSDLCKDIKI